jgi:phytoene synthase
LGVVLAAGRESMAIRIRLAWWRDALEALDREAAPPEPVLQAIQSRLLPAGISGTELAAMEEGWASLLADSLSADDLAIHAAARGGLLFRYSARLLGAPDPRADAAGEVWALVDLARRNRRAEESARAYAEAAARRTAWRWPRPLRPLGMLAALADRDIDLGPARMERRGAPGRMWRMARHRLTGR